MTRVRPNVCLLLFTILFCVHEVSGCYTCKDEVMYEIQEFIHMQPKNTGMQMHRLLKSAENNFKTIAGRHGGVIIPDTLSKVFTDVQTRFDILKKTSQAGDVVDKFSQFLSECSEFLDTHMSDGLCPDNNCGLSYQLVVNSTMCDTGEAEGPLQIYKCFLSDKLDCGQNYVRAKQGGEALLNCSLPRLLIPTWSTQYLYEWTPELDQYADSDFFKTLKVINDSYMLLMNVSTDMQGTYRCSLTNRSSGTVFSRMTFLLNVERPEPQPDVIPTTRVPEGDVSPATPKPEGDVIPMKPGVRVTIKPGVTATPAPQPTKAPPPGGPDIAIIIVIVASVVGVGGGVIFLGTKWLKSRRQPE